MRIDAHQHFWLFDPVKDSWITEEMAVISRNFLPNDIGQILKDNNFDGVVAVQADQSHQETDFLVELSGVYKLIKAVVGWVDLRSEAIDEHLAHFKRSPIIKGFRHIVEGEVDPDFLHRDEFLRGIAALTKHQYTYDLLIRPRHYASTLKCVSVNPEQAFMLDHIAKPPIKTQEFDEWAAFIHDLAQYENVHCKISGLATEADWKHWTLDHFTQYIAHVISCFGKDRVLFGSDWPVCLLAGSYEDSIRIVEDKLNDFTEAELKGFWGDNAVQFYSIT
ncbi:amidohydrolase family protein [Sphingobacterium sp. DK4209]|uniref:Amidohydrolase family protein n=1 Tax=Sphingobacterium zhuxiongii TaxID=2662364 RepID=A0A5Q0QEB7_9SPHI|nr:MULTISPECIES: amidohydrolase family protein [unclassified Sphingobacterium]MVZ64542.1 amidohydrolase family protein [Sphingobacterium sp. DK4209]QGA25872.1 amidohydrolase family protein [Sphingobacterium sp. dk4302]